ncbi:MAG: phosphoglycerate kinase [Candidatus Micrarchaeota archaeon]
MRNIMDYDVKGKKILIRVDLNSPVAQGRIVPNERLVEHAKTLQQLSDRGAKVIALAHQGREGDPDFIMLEQHAEALADITKKEITFVPHVLGHNVKATVESMKNGDIVLLENVRFLKSENLESGEIVALSYLGDYYVLDAMSVAHRAHSSVVGFSKIIPAFYGPILAEEVKAIAKIRNADEVTFVLGGSKAKDSFTIIEYWLKTGKKGKFLIGGALSILLLKAKGHAVGDSEKYLEEEGLLEYLDRAKKIATAEGVMLPIDVGIMHDNKRSDVDVSQVSSGQIWDIGKKTAEQYVKIIVGSKNLVMNGPMGVYEQPHFDQGTRKVIEAMANSSGFTLLGGGHTITALQAFGFKKTQFGYVSLSGKALIEYISGKELPGLKALDENEKNFKI